MKITVIGVGYVGLVQAACLAELGNEVWGIDIDEKKIANLKKGIIPIFEPGLTEIVKRNLGNNRLKFSTNISQAVKETKIIFIAVGTPPKHDGEADLSFVEAAAEEVGKNINNYKLIVNKSTVPIGTGDMLAKIVGKFHHEFDVASNPEFLREGSAVEDFMKPERIVIGGANLKAKELLAKLYQPLNAPLLYTDLKTAEMIKYASNSMLATQISFINAIANICERVGANIEDVAKGMKLDGRIGKRSQLNAGAGYGGSCLPKDVKALIQIARRHDYKFKILESVEDVNQSQRQSLTNKILRALRLPKGKTVAVWGLAFKPKTDDMREAPSIDIINSLLAQGVKIVAYDPVAQKEAKRIMPKISFAADPYKTVKDADLLAIFTEWDEFKQIDLEKVKKILKKPLIVDGRNIYNPSDMKKLGFKYLSVGR